MKNIFRTVLLTALACLLCFSCTNINDPETLKAEQFTVNEMKVEGFYVEGLDASYDGKTVELVYVTKDAETVIGESSIIADNSKLYKSGSTKIKFTNPELIKEKGTFYLKLEGGDKVQVLNEKMEMVNADLGIISSAYGTKEDGLAKKMVVVKAASIVSKSIPATFAWEDAAKVSNPVLTFYIIGDLPGVTNWNWDDKDKLVMKAESASEQVWEYTATSTKTIEFKFTNAPSWDAVINAGADENQDVTLGTAYELTLGIGSKNCKLAVTKDKKYKFVLNVADPTKLTIKVTEAE